MTYATALKAHLEQYKRNRLGISEPGAWRGGAKYHHILPSEQQKLNILPSVRDEFWAWHAQHADDVPLHVDFAHLNSSQAFAFNLIFPWCANDATRGALLTALSVDATTFSDQSFEAMPDQNERTTLDFFAVLNNGARLLVEVKLTEGAFGAATKPETLEERRTRTYDPMLEGKFIDPGLTPAEFALAFQLVRNMAYVDLTRGDHLVLIVPCANLNPWAQAEDFLRRLTPTARERVRLVAAENLVLRLSELAAHAHPALVAPVNELVEKYFPDIAKGNA